MLRGEKRVEARLDKKPFERAEGRRRNNGRALAAEGGHLRVRGRAPTSTTRTVTRVTKFDEHRRSPEKRGGPGGVSWREKGGRRRGGLRRVRGRGRDRKARARYRGRAAEKVAPARLWPGTGDTPARLWPGTGDTPARLWPGTGDTPATTSGRRASFSGSNQRGGAKNEKSGAVGAPGGGEIERPGANGPKSAAYAQE